jgi:trigger factor
MQVSVSTTGSLERRVEVAVPATEIAQEVEERLKRMSHTARLKGFRPGKVPFAVLRAQYGDAIRAEVVNDKMRSSLGQALDEQKLRPAGGTRIEPIAMDPEGDLKFVAVFDVVPEVQLKPAADLAVERLVAEVTETDIDSMIASMRRQRMQYTEFADVARQGDRVLIDYDGRIDGEPFQGGTAKDVEVIIGAGQAAPELDESLKGTRAGEQREITLHLADTLSNKAIAGKTAQLQVSIKRVDEPTLPEVDDEFCRAYGVEEGGAEGLRREVRNSMEQELQAQLKARLHRAAIDALYRDNPVEVPRGMVEQEMRRLQLEAGRRAGIKDPVNEAAQLMPVETFRPLAHRRTALSFILGRIVESEKLQPDPQRIEQRLTDEAAAYQEPEKARAAMRSRKDVMEQIAMAVLEEQAVEWVLAHAQITDVPRTFREVTGFGREERSDDNSENAQ